MLASTIGMCECAVVARVALLLISWREIMLKRRVGKNKCVVGVRGDLNATGTS